MKVADATLHILRHEAAFVRHDGQRRLGEKAFHPGPLARRERLLDELHTERLQLRREGQRLLDGPSTIRVHAEGGDRVLAQLADDGEVVLCAELDFVNGPALELAELHHHRLDGINADGVVAQWHAALLQSPELPNWLTALFPPQVVRRLVQRAHGEAVVAEHGQQPIPQRSGIVEFLTFNASTNSFDVGPHTGRSECQISGARSALSVASEPAIS